MRRIDSAVPNPTRAAIAATVSSESSSSAAGGLDASGGDVAGRRHADLGGEPAQEVALADRHPGRQDGRSGGRRAGSASISSWAWRTGSWRARRRHTGAANWLCVPGRRRNTTSHRATVSATSTPWSSSTSASARSIPAVTPADVHTSRRGPRSGSASTSTPGCSAASRRAVPSGSSPADRPAAPPRRGGTHRCRHRRRGAHRRPSLQLHRPARRRAMAWWTPEPPGTISVSTAPSSSGAATICSPLSDRTGPGSHREDVHGVAAPAAPTTLLAPQKTSCGPVTSSAWTPS